MNSISICFTSQKNEYFVKEAMQNDWRNFGGTSNEKEGRSNKQNDWRKFGGTSNQREGRSNRII